jgi:hypothetical protein
VANICPLGRTNGEEIKKRCIVTIQKSLLAFIFRVEYSSDYQITWHHIPDVSKLQKVDPKLHQD